jgi:hypothetical protein
LPPEPELSVAPFLVIVAAPSAVNPFKKTCGKAKLISPLNVVFDYR